METNVLILIVFVILLLLALGAAVFFFWEKFLEWRRQIRYKYQRIGRDIVVDGAAHFEESQSKNNGYKAAGQNSGKPNSYKSNIRAFYHQFQSAVAANDVQTQERKDKWNAIKESAINKIKGWIKEKDDDINRWNEKKDNNEKDIETKQAEIKDSQTQIKIFNQQKLNIKINEPADSKDKIFFWIMLLTLIGALLYSYFFYVTTTYCGMFRQFSENDLASLSGLLDPKVFSSLANSGLMAWIVSFGLPFIIFALACLLHSFLTKKDIRSKICLILIVSVTFLFDFFITYSIVKKSFEASAINAFQDNIEFTIPQAFGNTDFWTVVLMGFVSYIIVSVLFHTFMQRLDSLDPKKAVKNKIDFQINEEEKKIKTNNRLIKRLERINKKIDSKTIDRLKADKNYLEGLLEKEQNDFKKGAQIICQIADPSVLQQHLNSFLSGWLQYLSPLPNIPPDYKTIPIQETEKLLSEIKKSPTSRVLTDDAKEIKAEESKGADDEK